jgi:hypothetical protein
VIELHRARMGVDKWRHRLQGDKQPEHQEAGGSVRHNRATCIELGNTLFIRLQTRSRIGQPGGVDK